MAESEIDIEQQVTITQGLGLQEEPDKRSEMEAEMNGYYISDKHTII